jgi:hypothetical protein
MGFFDNIRDSMRSKSLGNLVLKLNSDEFTIRKQAILTLQNGQDKDIIPQIIQNLHYSYYREGGRSGVSLEEKGLREMVASCKALCCFGEAVINPLLDHLRDAHIPETDTGYLSLVRRIVSTIGKVFGEPITFVLCDRMSRKEEGNITNQIILIIGEIGDKKVTSQIINKLEISLASEYKSTKVEGRTSSCCVALNEMDDDRAIPVLLQVALMNSNRSEYCPALELIGRLCLDQQVLDRLSEHNNNHPIKSDSTNAWSEKYQTINYAITGIMRNIKNGKRSDFTVSTQPDRRMDWWLIIWQDLVQIRA